MGCGQSSLKGEKHEEQEQPAKPMTKVATNFSTINYDGATTERNNSVYAPHDEIRHKSDALSPLTEKKTNPLSLDATATTTPATGAVHPETATASTSTAPTAFENHLPTQTNAEQESVEPYRDVTASPTTPIAPNASSAFPEPQHPEKPTTTQ